MSLAEILQDSRPSGPKPAPGLALGLVPLISQTRPTTTEGTLNKQSNRLTLPSSGSVWHCVRPQAMLDSLTRVNLQPVPLKSQDWAKKTPSLNPPHYSEASWPAGGQHGGEKTARNLRNTRVTFLFHGVEYSVDSWSVQPTTLECCIGQPLFLRGQQQGEA